MKKHVFTGAGTALVTPMHADGAVNYERLRTLVDEQIAGGADALIVCGTTGESSTLDHREHTLVIQTAVEQAAGRIPVIAGTGSNDTRYAVALSKEAEALGADALLMVTPYYNKTSQAGLIAHYLYVAERVDLPIILYNVPSRTGTNILPQTYQKLSEHPNIVATKEASGDFSNLAKTRALCGEELEIYSGNDDQIVPILSLGGIGVISVLSNLLPSVPHDICRAYFDGDVKKAAQLQLKYLPLINALFADVNPIPVKQAMSILDMQTGPCRLPLVPPNDTIKAALEKELRSLGL